jgi:hypothetical protein
LTINESNKGNDKSVDSSVSDDSSLDKKNLDRQFLQVPMEDWAFDGWTEISKKHKKYKKVMLEVLIIEYIQTKAQYKFDIEKPQKRIVPYIAVLGAKARSIWLSNEIYLVMEDFAKSVPIKINRVVYSALIEGLVRENIIKL